MGLKLLHWFGKHSRSGIYPLPRVWIVEVEGLEAGIIADWARGFEGV